MAEIADIKDVLDIADAPESASGQESVEDARVIATDAALALIEEIKSVHGTDLVFHQSGGCCDGSSPMCFETKDFRIGTRDVHLGDIGGVPFYIGGAQYEQWKHTRLIIDAVSGRGGMFSLDNGTGKRFLTRSDVCAI